MGSALFSPAESGRSPGTSSCPCLLMLALMLRAMVTEGLGWSGGESVRGRRAGPGLSHRAAAKLPWLCSNRRGLPGSQPVTAPARAQCWWCLQDDARLPGSSGLGAEGPGIPVLPQPTWSSLPRPGQPWEPGSCLLVVCLVVCSPGGLRSRPSARPACLWRRVAIA